MADKRLIPAGIKDLNAEAFNELIDRLGSIDLTPLLIYIIDHVDSSALPHLAWQFHIEGWELAETDKEKRTLIKRAIELHRYKGTPWAVKEAIKACGYEADISEWFQYDGQPYMFRVYIQKPVQSEDTYTKLLRHIYDCKNERSWLDSIGTHHGYTGKVYVDSRVWLGMRYTIQPNMPEIYVSPARYYGGFYYRVGNYMSIGVSNG
ncbi:putative phage tail fiber protein [Thermodesulfovibrio sp. N1]|uniref:phage tail protein I n=1 Tax=unclassified Thermodesulfovibrio TaxID=2645936 RepID=UPI00083B6E26|nr:MULTISPECIES: phage tail protein I [unclassified Thermodesulfovibrio]MDI1471939.1 phage tail protein I [Thermodesulfovibrio sp. 1176]ODA44242.1 putative phage tail fiber protein [Thermodesulfovibrio sp. N1]